MFRKDGRLIWADSFHITEEIFPHLRRRAVLANRKAVATLIYFGPQLDARLEVVRGIAPSLGCHCAATRVSGLLIVRVAAMQACELRRALQSLLQQFKQALGSGPFKVPKMWSC